MDDVWREQWRDTYIPCNCAECGKVFVPPVKTQWAYKRGSKSHRRDGGAYVIYFCSWGCMRKYDRESVPPVSRRGRKKKEAVTV